MRVLIVLLASTLAIEDLERDALGAPGPPTRANLRGLKFGHSVTEVEEEATDPPAPAPTAPPTAPAGNPHADFLYSHDCAADCFDCNPIDASMASDFAYDFKYQASCICYAGPMDAAYSGYFYGTQYDDCIAITEWTIEGDNSVLMEIFGEDGDDVISAAGTTDASVSVFGDGGTDDCAIGSIEYHAALRQIDCETYLYTRM